jgi:DNA-binding PucR family transcriptional regulator
VKLELNGNDRIVGVEVLGRATEVQLAPQKLTEAEKLTQEITLLWDARTSLGEVFLNNQDDREEMRALLATHETPLLREALLDAVTEALQDAADDFPDDLPGRALVSEWLEERAAKYRSGELDVL